MKYKILHIPTGAYYTGVYDMPSFLRETDTAPAIFNNIKDIIFTIARIIYYCKIKPACFVIDSEFYAVPILENELEIIEIEE